MLRVLSLLFIIIGAAVLAFGGKSLILPELQLSDNGMEAAPPIEIASVEEDLIEDELVEESFDEGEESSDQPTMRTASALERSAGFDDFDVESAAEDIVETGLDMISAAPLESFSSELREVPIAYEKPDSAQVGVPFDVTLVIDGTGDATAADDLPGEETVTESSAKVSSSVSAVLSGSGFEIATRSPIRQSLSPFESNRWQWRVTPVKPGNAELTMEIFAHVDGTALPVRTYRDKLPIEITPLSRVINIATQANPVAAVLGGLGSLIAGLFGAARFFGRKEGVS